MMATEHENWVDWARQSADAEIRDLRVEWQAAIARAEQAEAALRTAAEALRQIVEWSSDGSYRADYSDIERAARDGLALITGEVQP